MWITISDEAEARDHRNKLLTMTNSEFNEYMCLKFPSQYSADKSSPDKSCMYFGCEIPAGWRNAFEDLCQHIATLDKLTGAKLVWTQVKSKFASGRFYFDLLDCKDENVDKLYSRLIDLVESEVGHMCEYCGSYSKMHTISGWNYTLCDEHYKEAIKAFNENNPKHEDPNAMFLYYLRDEANKPYGCVALKKADDVWCRGVAICAPGDNFVKSLARNMATGRCIQAATNKQSCEPMKSTHGNVWEFYKYIRNDIRVHDEECFKSKWDAKLTPHEQQIVKDVNKTA